MSILILILTFSGVALILIGFSLTGSGLRLIYLDQHASCPVSSVYCLNLISLLMTLSSCSLLVTSSGAYWGLLLLSLRPMLRILCSYLSPLWFRWWSSSASSYPWFSSDCADKDREAGHLRLHFTRSKASSMAFTLKLLTQASTSPDVSSPNSAVL